MNDLNAMMANLAVTCRTLATRARAEAASIRSTPMPSIGSSYTPSARGGPSDIADPAQRLRDQIASEREAKAGRFDAKAALYDRRAGHLDGGVIGIETFADFEWNGLSSVVMDEARKQGRTIVDLDAKAPERDVAVKTYSFAGR